MDPTFQILTHLSRTPIFYIINPDEINISIFTSLNNSGQTAKKLKDESSE